MIQKRVYARGGKRYGLATGTTRRCQLEGCCGTRLGVRWPDGKITWPCTKGLGLGPVPGSLVIL
jgi:hypothetical protein